MEQAKDFKELNIQRRIWRLRREGKSWFEVTSKINEEFDNKTTSKRVKEMYEQYAARSQVISSTTKNGKNEALKASREWKEEIDQLIELLNDKVKVYLKMADELMIESYESGNRKAFFKDLPAFNNLLRSLQEQVKLLKDTQQKIQINQKSLILNETKILQIVNHAYSQKAKETGYVIHPGTGQLISIDKKKKILD